VTQPQLTKTEEELEEERRQFRALIAAQNAPKVIPAKSENTKAGSSSSSIDERYKRMLDTSSSDDDGNEDGDNGEDNGDKEKGGDDAGDGEK